MNKAYSLVWNDAQGSWCAVGETAHRRGKSGGGKQLIAAAGVSLLGLAASSAYALPTGGEIAAGKADIATSADGKTMSINQHTDKLITNWQDFSVAGGERVSFHQLSNQSIALNRVIGTNGSQIHGQIDANGKVFVVNPNGVVFGAGAQVNVGGLVASTKHISDKDFLAGTYRFAGASGQSVENAGTITAAEGGSVALLGARVSNTGVIRAQAGRVALGAGEAFNVNFDGGLLNLQVEGGAMDAQVHNGGLLKADGGEVLMTARAANGLLNAVVNNSGTIEAHGLKARDGKIVLDGGLVQVGGKLNAAGGTVTTRGERVAVSRDAQVDTRGAAGRTGTWTVEAANANVNDADGAIGAQTLARNLGTTNVALTNTSGDLTVGGAVNWTSDHALTLTSRKGNVDLKQAVTASGANAGVTVNAAHGIRIHDKLALTGENARLTLNSGSGHALTNDNAAVTLPGRNASFSSNGEAYQVVHDLAGLRKFEDDPSGRYVLGNAIDGRGAQFLSIGSNWRVFRGVFDGLGNTIGNLSVSNPGSSVVGLFAINQGLITNLGLEKITAKVSVPNGGSSVQVGALAGYNSGTISNVKAKDVVVSGSGRAIVGGLVGTNADGWIDRASVSGRVEGGRDAMQVGGLAGENLGIAEWESGKGGGVISNSRADVQVVSQSTGGFAGVNRGGTGGLVGFNRGVILSSTAAGSVSANAATTAYVGGLVGVNESGVVRESSSSANVRAGHYAAAGGLVGYNGGSIDASDATGSVTVGNSSRAGGLVGDNRGKVDASTSSANVSSGLSGEIGGLVGVNRGTVLASSASGSVKAGNSAWAGGLVGENYGKIASSSASGTVSGGGNALLGGLTGGNFGTVERSTASGRIAYAAGYGQHYGGLAGFSNGSMTGNTVTGSAAAVPLVGITGVVSRN
ncbi:filamentous hemagglutinin N-terminal domain-containing protein [Burkholderia sp. 4701]|nr:filamentous hemagglutinin N-terminal domain-containing protein [Burkholderia sp. 4701]MXN81361.1 filamentous hemagglutinin N-terminal domain-containing protein [Burkholderia sp. 4812]